jgi:hypothetical protein
MENYLNHLLEESAEGMVPVQLVFVPGAVQAAGALRAGPVEGTFELCYPAPVGRQGASLAQGADEVLVSDVFTAAGVLRVIHMKDAADSLIATPGSPGIVGPGGF